MKTDFSLPISAQNTMEFIPDEYKEHPEPLTYVLRVPTQRLEGKVQHRMISTVGPLPSDDVMYNELRTALKELMKDAPEELAEVLDVVKRMESANAALAQMVFDNNASKEQLLSNIDIDEEMVDAFTQLAFSVARAWPPYRELLADRAFYYNQIYPVSAQIYVVGHKACTI